MLHRQIKTVTAEVYGPAFPDEAVPHLPARSIRTGITPESVRISFILGGVFPLLHFNRQEPNLHAIPIARNVYGASGKNAATETGRRRLGLRSPLSRSIKGDGRP
jgi:hypothetical protein